MRKHEPRLMEGDEFPVCCCGCVSYTYDIVPVFSLRSFEGSILTDLAHFESLQVGHWCCAGCGINAFVLIARDVKGRTVLSWMLPIGKNVCK